MMTRRWTGWAVIGLALAPVLCGGQAPQLGDEALLLKAYCHYMLTREIPAQGKALAEGATPADAEAIGRALNEWSAGQVVAIRRELERRFGEEARTRFEEFVSEFTAAEERKDAAYLAALAAAIRRTPPPADYAGLRKAAVNALLRQEIESASKWLADVQTWRDLRAQRDDVPALEVWLAREAPEEQEAAMPPAAARAPARAVNPLAEAEAPLPELQTDEEGESAGPLDSFDSLRRERRARALKEAQAGMAQVAAERQAAEQEYAAKKTAAAQAEAESLKRHAEKLAAAEKEAAVQRQNSWSSRLKNIVGATITAATGAFTGGVGTRAGEALANEVFK